LAEFAAVGYAASRDSAGPCESRADGHTQACVVYRRPTHLRWCLEDTVSQIDLAPLGVGAAQVEISTNEGRAAKCMPPIAGLTVVRIRAVLGPSSASRRAGDRMRSRSLDRLSGKCGAQLALKLVRDQPCRAKCNAVSETEYAAHIKLPV
jgi:hypothetical protein